MRSRFEISYEFPGVHFNILSRIDCAWGKVGNLVLSEIVTGVYDGTRDGISWFGKIEAVEI